ncbi:MAG TPA: tetratricopeptide repeat protein [Oleiagrimonas sp.]|nr:tetratricopeptide repeat protein [Oleiagrimonas sp.]
MAYDDFEQGERIKEWLRHNGVAVVVGIVIGLALIFGYRQWNQHKADESAAAANQYRLIVNAYANDKAKQAGTLTDSLMKNHAQSSYAVFAATLRAKHYLGVDKSDKAIASLTWAAKHAGAGPLKVLSQIRLARAQINADKASDALDTLKAIPADAYNGLVAELRGDAQVKLKHDDAAIKAYQSAMAAFDEGSPQQRIVKMKIQNLGGKPKPTAKAVSHAATVATPSSSELQDA